MFNHDPMIPLSPSLFPSPWSSSQNLCIEKNYHQKVNMYKNERKSKQLFNCNATYLTELAWSLPKQEIPVDLARVTSCTNFMSIEHYLLQIWP